MAVKAKYLEDLDNPHREFYQDIPARDLDDDDWGALDKEQQERIAASTIYRVAGAPAAKSVTAPADELEKPSS